MAQEFYPYDQPPRSEYDKMGGVAPGGGAVDALVRAYKVQMQRNAVNAQDAPVRAVDTTGVKPLYGLPTPTLPAATQNAVANTTAQVETPKAASPTAAPKTDVAPPRNSNTVSGPVSGYAPNAGLPYPGRDTPADRAASVLPAMPAISFYSPPAAVASGARGMQSNLGMISPGIDMEAATMLDEARPLLSSAGIVDRLRGRQMMRARSRMLADAANLAGVRVQGANAEANRVGADASMLGAQTGAFRASNEVPLALLQSATQRYGIDTTRYGYDQQAATARMQDATNRYTNDQNNRTLQRGQELQLLPNMEAVTRAGLYSAAAATGDTEEMERLAREGRFPPAERAPTTVLDPSGRYAITGGKVWDPMEELKTRRVDGSGLALPAYRR